MAPHAPYPCLWWPRKRDRPLGTSLQLSYRRGHHLASTVPTNPSLRDALSSTRVKYMRADAPLVRPLRLRVK